VRKTETVPLFGVEEVDHNMIDICYGVHHLTRCHSRSRISSEAVGEMIIGVFKVAATAASAAAAAADYSIKLLIRLVLLSLRPKFNSFV
jgi:hypothetical protein